MALDLSQRQHMKVCQPSQHDKRSALQQVEYQCLLFHELVSRYPKFQALQIHGIALEEFEQF